MNRFKIVIEKGIPISGWKNSGKFFRKGWLFLLEKMEVGDSFVLPVASAKKFQVWFCRNRKREVLPDKYLNLTLVTRTIDKHNIRIWLTKPCE